MVEAVTRGEFIVGARASRFDELVAGRDQLALVVKL